MATFADGGFCPDVDMAVDVNRRMQIAQYGDGYRQVALDGINSLEKEWSVQFTNRPAYLITQMTRYLEATNGGGFPFMDPATGELATVSCEEWSVSWTVKRYGTGDLYGSLEAKFKTWNGLAVIA